MAKRDSLFADGANFSGIELRQLPEALQAGVFQAGDFKVTSSGSGAIASALTSASGQAVIQANQAGIFRPGKYLVADDAAERSELWERFGGGSGIPTNATASPRLDAVVLQQYDGTGLGDGSGRRDWVRRYIPGVATPGVALGGALPALPSNCLLIAEVLVPANTPTTIPNANIRDRRPWAKGAYRSIVRTSNAGGTDHYTKATATAITFANSTLMDSTNLYPRLECSGVRIKARLSGSKNMPDNNYHGCYLDVDGANPYARDKVEMNEIGDRPFEWIWDYTPPAGSHLIGPRFVSAGANFVIHANAGSAPLVFEIEEIVRPNADNS